MPVWNRRKRKAEARPGAPELVAAAYASPSAVRVEWTAVPGALQYECSCFDKVGRARAVFVPAPRTSAVVDAPAGGGVYGAHVRAQTASGWGPWSEPEQVGPERPAPAAPPPPFGFGFFGHRGAAAASAGLPAPVVAVVAVTATSATLEWTPVALASEYQVECLWPAEHGGAVSARFAKTKAVITHLDPGVQYSVRVRAGGGSGLGWGPWSPTKHFTTSASATGGAARGDHAPKARCRAPPVHEWLIHAVGLLGELGRGALRDVSWSELRTWAEATALASRRAGGEACRATAHAAKEEWAALRADPSMAYVRRRGRELGAEAGRFLYPTGLFSDLVFLTTAAWAFALVGVDGRATATGAWLKTWWWVWNLLWFAIAALFAAAYKERLRNLWAQPGGGLGVLTFAAYALKFAALPTVILWGLVWVASWAWWLLLRLLDWVFWPPLVTTVIIVATLLVLSFADLDGAERGGRASSGRGWQAGSGVGAGASGGSGSFRRRPR